jgi:Cys-rich protein (TIGR01571 family)
MVGCGKHYQQTTSTPIIQMQEKWTFQDIAPLSAPVGDGFEENEEKKSWRTGICGWLTNCSDLPICCAVTWCTPCAVAQIYDLSGASGLKKSQRGRMSWTYIGTLTLLMLIFALSVIFAQLPTVALFIQVTSIAVIFALVFSARQKIRSDENIEGSCAWDFCFSCFCSPCSICQMFSQKQVKCACCGGEFEEGEVKYNQPFKPLEPV